MTEETLKGTSKCHCGYDELHAVYHGICLVKKFGCKCYSCTLSTPQDWREDLAVQIENDIQEILEYRGIESLGKNFLSDVQNRIIPRMEVLQEETSKAFGGCTDCYGKGYATTMVQAGAARWGIWELDPIRPCHCGRGKQIDILGQTKYDAGRAQERTRIKAIVEGMKIRKDIKTASEPVCSVCGFPIDHSQCMCPHNNTIAQILTRIDTE